MCEMTDIDSILKGELTESETIYWQTANKYIADIIRSSLKSRELMLGTYLLITHTHFEPIYAGPEISISLLRTPGEEKHIRANQRTLTSFGLADEFKHRAGRGCTKKLS